MFLDEIFGNSGRWCLINKYTVFMVDCMMGKIQVGFVVCGGDVTYFVMLPNVSKQSIHSCHVICQALKLVIDVQISKYLQ